MPASIPNDLRVSGMMLRALLVVYEAHRIGVTPLRVQTRYLRKRSVQGLERRRLVTACYGSDTVEVWLQPRGMERAVGFLDAARLDPGVLRIILDRLPAAGVVEAMHMAEERDE